MFQFQDELVIKSASLLYVFIVVDFGEQQQINELPFKSPMKTCFQAWSVGPGVVAELIRMCTLDTSQKAVCPMQIFKCLMFAQMCVLIATVQRTKLCCEFMSMHGAFFVNSGKKLNEMRWKNLFLIPLELILIALAGRMNFLHNNYIARIEYLFWFDSVHGIQYMLMCLLAPFKVPTAK